MRLVDVAPTLSSFLPALQVKFAMRWDTAAAPTTSTCPSVTWLQVAQHCAAIPGVPVDFPEVHCGSEREAKGFFQMILWSLLFSLIFAVEKKYMPLVRFRKYND